MQAAISKITRFLPVKSRILHRGIAVLTRNGRRDVHPVLVGNSFEEHHSYRDSSSVTLEAFVLPQMQHASEEPTARFSLLLSLGFWGESSKLRATRDIG